MPEKMKPREAKVKQMEIVGSKRFEAPRLPGALLSESDKRKVPHATCKNRDYMTLGPPWPMFLWQHPTKLLSCNRQSRRCWTWGANPFGVENTMAPVISNFKDSVGHCLAQALALTAQSANESEAKRRKIALAALPWANSREGEEFQKRYKMFLSQVFEGEVYADVKKMKEQEITLNQLKKTEAETRATLDLATKNARKKKDKRAKVSEAT